MDLVRVSRVVGLGQALSMISLLAAFSGTAVVSAADAPVRLDNPAEPRHGRQTVELIERWTAGDDEDEVFFGVVQHIVLGSDGNLYLLDRQLSQVQVFGPGGEHLRTLSREGEGPGEMRHPGGLLFLPDGSLGLIQGFPGKLVLIDRQGDPVGELVPKPASEEGGFVSFMGGSARGGALVLVGQHVTIEPGRASTFERFVGVFDEAGRETARILTRKNTANRMQRWVEKDEDFVVQGRWAVGPDGSVYVAPERDRYEIHRFSSDGTLQQVITRPFEPLRRTEQEKERAAEGVIMIVNGERIVPEMVIEETNPCIMSLVVSNDGELWVRHARSATDQPDGIMESWDVFDPEGRYDRQVAFRVAGDAERDRLLLLTGPSTPGEAKTVTSSLQFVMLRGYAGALESMFGGNGDEGAESEEVEPLSIVALRVRS